MCHHRGNCPFTVARNANDYPVFDRDAEAIPCNYLHGYAKLASDGVTALCLRPGAVLFALYGAGADDARVG